MKAVFSNTDHLDDWLDSMVSPSKYDLYYVTLHRRLIAIKNVSTSPRLHAVVNDVDIEDAQTVADSHGVKLTTVKRFDWSHERDPSDTNI